MYFINRILKYSPVCLSVVAAHAWAANCSGTDDIICTEKDYVSAASYYKYNYDGDLSLSFTDSAISAPGVAINEGASTSGEASLQADNLTTSAGGIAISGGGVDVQLNNSTIGGGAASGTALSVSQTALNMNTTIAITDSALNGATFVNEADGNVVFSAEDSVFYGEIHIHETNAASGVDNDKTTNVSLTNSTIDTSGVISSSENYPVYVESEKGTLNVLMEGDTIIQTGSHNDVTITSGTGNNSGSAVNAEIDNSSLTNGISASTSNPYSSSTVTVRNSTIAQNTPSWGTAIVASAGETDSEYSGSGNATINIENSQINGNVAAETFGGGSSTVSLSDNAAVNGDVLAIGTENSVNIDGAILNGDIQFSTSHDDSSVTTSSTVNLANARYDGNIATNDGSAEDNLTININSNAVIGGDSVSDAMQITGFDTVGVNINYLDPSLVNSDEAKYFYFNSGETVAVQNGTSGTLSPVRSGSYIYDNVKYVATDESASQAAGLDGSTWAVSFIDDTPVPDDKSNVVSDIQAAQAGLVASDDMIHRVADDITGHLDMRTGGSNVWLSGLYAGSNREAGQTKYQNDISGAQFGGYLSVDLASGDSLTVGVANAWLHNALDLQNKDGHNSINGTYYSLYGRWEQPKTRDIRWFSDAVVAWGNMSYSASGNDDGIRGHGDYDGNTWLLQGRVGATFVANRIEFQPYTTLGYVNVKTDGYSDGYSDIGDGKQTNYFAGGGVRMMTHVAVPAVQDVKPYLTLGYNAQFGGSTELNTDDYSFSGEDLNGGTAAAGVMVDFTPRWAGKVQVATEFGHAIDAAVAGDVMLSYRF